MSEALQPPSLDPDSVGALWREIHGLIRPRVGSADRADDVVQEAFLHALRRPPRDPRGIGAWLLVVARHLASRSRKCERNRNARERLVAAASPRRASGVAAHAAERREVQRLLATLAEPYREVLRLRYLEGCEIEEVAQRLGRAPGTVRSQIKRGIDRIRQRLGTQSRSRLSGLLGLAWLRARWKAQRELATACAVAGALLAITGACALVAAVLARRPWLEAGA